MAASLSSFKTITGVQEDTAKDISFAQLKALAVPSANSNTTTAQAFKITAGTGTLYYKASDSWTEITDFSTTNTIWLTKDGISQKLVESPNTVTVISSGNPNLRWIPAADANKTDTDGSGGSTNDIGAITAFNATAYTAVGGTEITTSDATVNADVLAVNDAPTIAGGTTTTFTAAHAGIAYPVDLTALKAKLNTNTLADVDNVAGDLTFVVKSINDNLTQVSTITLGGTFGASDTITIGGVATNPVALIGAGITSETVAAAINAASGAKVIATFSGSNVVLTDKTAGTGFDPTVSEIGGGTANLVATTPNASALGVLKYATVSDFATAVNATTHQLNDGYVSHFNGTTTDYYSTGDTIAVDTEITGTDLAVWIPNANLSVATYDAFTVSAWDGQLESTGTATFKFDVATPVANTDTVTIAEDAPATILASDLLGNDTDAGETLKIRAVHIANEDAGKTTANAGKSTDAAGNSVSLNSNGDVIFTPIANNNKPLTFNYTVETPSYESTAVLPTSMTNAVTVNFTAAADAPTLDVTTNSSKPRQITEARADAGVALVNSTEAASTITSILVDDVDSSATLNATPADDSVRVSVEVNAGDLTIVGFTVADQDAALNAAIDALTAAKEAADAAVTTLTTAQTTTAGTLTTATTDLGIAKNALGDTQTMLATHVAAAATAKTNFDANAAAITAANAAVVQATAAKNALTNDDTTTALDAANALVTALTTAATGLETAKTDADATVTEDQSDLAAKQAALVSAQTAYDTAFAADAAAQAQLTAAGDASTAAEDAIEAANGAAAVDSTATFTTVDATKTAVGTTNVSITLGGEVFTIPVASSAGTDTTTVASALQTAIRTHAGFGNVTVAGTDETTLTITDPSGRDFTAGSLTYSDNGTATFTDGAAGTAVSLANGAIALTNAATALNAVAGFLTAANATSDATTATGAATAALDKVLTFNADAYSNTSDGVADSVIDFTGNKAAVNAALASLKYHQDTLAGGSSDDVLTINTLSGSTIVDSRVVMLTVGTNDNAPSKYDFATGINPDDALLEPTPGNLTLVYSKMTDPMFIVEGASGQYSANNIVVTPNETGGLVLSENFTESDTSAAHTITLTPPVGSTTSFDLKGDKIQFTDGSTLQYSDLMSTAASPAPEKAVLYGTGNQDHLILAKAANAGGTLKGYMNIDKLDGSAGRDVLYGGDGNDIITGNSGNDYLNGGTGDDTFVFDEADGADVIADFDKASDTDQILLPSQQAIVISQSGADTLIKISETGSIRLMSTDASTIDEADFALPALPAGTDTEKPAISRVIVDGEGGYASLTGGTGDDTITGGEGSDAITGDLGNDVIKYNASNESTIDSVDVITGLVLNAGAADTIDLPSVGTLAVVASQNAGVAASALTEQNINILVGTGASVTDGTQALTTKFAGAENTNVAVLTTLDLKTFLAIDLDGNGAFSTASDMLIEITGATMAAVVDGSAGITVASFI